jgi:hypothetical protein
MRWTAQAGNGAVVGFSKEQRLIWMDEQTETARFRYVKLWTDPYSLCSLCFDSLIFSMTRRSSVESKRCFVPVKQLYYNIVLPILTGVK